MRLERVELRLLNNVPRTNKVKIELLIFNKISSKMIL